MNIEEALFQPFLRFYLRRSTLFTDTQSASVSTLLEILLSSSGYKKIASAYGFQPFLRFYSHDIVPAYAVHLHQFQPFLRFYRPRHPAWRVVEAVDPFQPFLRFYFACQLSAWSACCTIYRFNPS